ncbi:MAG: hypothetical protein H7141_01390 [Burkholderiales bacterium]|nr:hypothetical protein [Bacteroidia bacterium]
MITSFADLDREEIRVKKRVLKQEEEIKLKFKTLPEEIITTGVTKIISGTLNGDLFKSTFSIIKTVGKLLSGGKNDDSSSGNGIMSIIKNIVRAKLSD